MSRAIQAALEFPEAEVVATDLNPLPNRYEASGVFKRNGTMTDPHSRRSLPRNVRFLEVDVTNPLPFEEGSFDVVHARLVLMHVRRI